MNASHRDAQRYSGQREACTATVWQPAGCALYQAANTSGGQTLTGLMMLGRTKCPPTWIDWRRSCYHYVNKDVNPMDAEAACRGHNPRAHLTSVASREDLDFLLEHLINGRDVVIGLVRSPGATGWHWTDGETSAYRNYADKEPKDDVNRLYTHMKHDDGEWVTKKSDNKAHYVCKILQ
ncbi:regenerating islet-derived protein 4-like [Pollicipes pollicipes]|uniref:regenerating islet-derived protein 4-like n=1 Tax=Pollicipes pollicipes TaxID=41117 RepID=UPI0018857081|nr:regenerating islet-derived protein 4-like [Pollicipes pollicipes]